MENDEFDGELNDKVLLLEMLHFTQPSNTVCCANTVPLLYMPEDEEKDIGFYRETVEINGMAIAWSVFNICGKKLILHVIKRSKGFRFLNST